MFAIDKDNIITMVKGDSAIIDFAVEGAELKSGDKVYFTVKKNYKQEQPTLQTVVSSFDKNIAKIILTPEQTEIEPGRYFYDIQVSFADGRKDTVVLPTYFMVIGGITND